MKRGKVEVYFDWDYGAWTVERSIGFYHTHYFFGPLVIVRKH